jgi:hypothetical protein
MAGTLTWDLPGCSVGVQREEIDAVLIQTAESQTEIRTAWAAAPRYRYTFKITGRTAVGGSTDEVNSIRSLYASCNGRWDSFTMEDPLSGSNVTARFDSPLRMTRIVPASANGAWWEMTFTVITVVNAT